MNNKLQNEGIMAKGYGIIAKQVMKDKELSIEAKAIYAYLSSYSGAGNVAYPSISLMCGDLNISDTRFYKYRKELVEKGYIVISKHRNEQGWTNNVYTLPIKPYPQIVGTQIVGTQNVGTQNKGTNKNSSNNNSSNNNSIKTSAELNDRFEKLWKLYPRKLGRKNAFKHYKKYVKEGVEDKDIEKGIKAYVKNIEKEKTKPSFIKHGSSWFYQKGWEDEYEVEEEIEYVKTEKYVVPEFTKEEEDKLNNLDF